MPSENTTGPFYEVTSKLYIHLPPCFASKPTEGIQEQLNGFLMRYVPQVDGVVLAHSDLKLLENAGRIINDSPYCHFWISVKLLIWRPRKGSILSGTINLQSPDHIGLLLYGTFNASIPSEHIPKDKYEFNPTSSTHKKRKAAADGAGEDDNGDINAINGFMNGEWVVKSTGESIGDEGVIEFEVTDLIRTNEMLTVTGSLKNVPVMQRRPSIMTPVMISMPQVQNTNALNAVAEDDEEDDEEVTAPAGTKRSAEGEAPATTTQVGKPESKRIKKEKSDKADKKEKKEKKEKKQEDVKEEGKNEKKDKKDKKEKKNKKNKE